MPITQYQRSDLNIIFVDDVKANLDDVATACKNIGVKRFTGIQYTAAASQQNNKTNQQVNPEVLAEQISLFGETKIWVAPENLGFANRLIAAQSAE